MKMPDTMPAMSEDAHESACRFMRPKRCAKCGDTPALIRVNLYMPSGRPAGVMHILRCVKKCKSQAMQELYADKRDAKLAWNASVIRRSREA